jgi:HSP20 family molecular chaperone IbpA
MRDTLKAMADMSVAAGARENSKQLEELKAENEQKLANLRAEQQKKEQQIEANGDAAINHIKTRVNARVENARAEAERKLASADQAIQQNYAELKKRAMHETGTLEKDLSIEQQKVEANKNALRDDETRTIRQSQAKIKEFVQNQEELRSATQKQTNQTVERYQRSGEEKLDKTKALYQGELQKTETEGQTKINQTVERNKHVYETTKAEARAKIRELKERDDQIIGTETGEAKSEINRIRAKVKDSTTKEERDGQDRLQRINELTKQQLEQARARASSVNEKLQTEYSREGQRIEVDGTTDIHERQSKFDTMKREQEIANKTNLKELEVQQLAKENRARQEHEARVEFTAKKLDDALDKERKDFAQQYGREMKVNQDTLAMHKEGFLKELYKQKVELDRRAGVQASRAEDPFYRLKEFDAKIAEGTNHYVLTAKVPAHEKDSVEVIVKPDKVVLSARRSYQDVDNQDGVKSSTNSYQTYRQEFALSAPVDDKKVRTEIKDDGSINVIMAKQPPKPMAKT